MIKRLTCLVVALLTAVLGGCSAPTADADGIDVVCASYAEYDWVKNLVGSTDVNITLLADNGTDMHSYQPTASDIAAVSKADLVVYTGGTADQWMTDALKVSANTDAALRLMDVLADRLLCQPSAVEEHDHDHSHDEDECAYDEHIWLSPENAAIACRAIYERLIDIDTANKEQYKSLYDSYMSTKLNPLKDKYDSALSQAKDKSVVFADRFPFVYLFNDYGIKFFAAFPGCSSEVDADFETVVALSKRVDELSLDCVVIVDGVNNKLAETVISNTKNKNQRVLSLNSLQSVTAKQLGSDISYCRLMEQNLEVLKIALGIKEGA